MSIRGIPPVEHENQISELRVSNGVEKDGVFESPKQRSMESAKPIDVPPDGGYGWVCVASVFIINFHTWGLNSVSPASLFIVTQQY